ncbi:MAG: XRE family transcriptional regulator [Ilumatobacteraceae bacterium]
MVTPTPHPADDDIARLVGSAVRTRRLALELTMQQLAEQTGLTQPFISKVERGLARLSIASINRISEALGVSAAGLFGSMSSDQRYDVVRRADRPRLQIDDDDVSVVRAFTRRAGQVSIVEFEGGPSKLHPFHFLHRNDQICVITAGRYEFEVDGDLLTLGSGDTVSIAGQVPTRYRVLRSPARMLLVLVSEDVDVVRRPGPGRGSQRRPLPT